MQWIILRTGSWTAVGPFSKTLHSHKKIDYFLVSMLPIKYVQPLTIFNTSFQDMLHRMQLHVVNFIT